jgi:hypothetical protein
MQMVLLQTHHFLPSCTPKPLAQFHKTLPLRPLHQKQTMPRAKKFKSNMELLVEAVNEDSELLALLQISHLPEHREDFSSQLRQQFATITGQKSGVSKDIYSDFLNFLQYVIPLLTDGRP